MFVILGIKSGLGLMVELETETFAGFDFIEGGFLDIKRLKVVFLVS